MTTKRRTYFLIPGAWMGKWIWEPTVNALKSQEHSAFSLTLTGLESDENVTDVSSITLETHVNDVLTCIEARELNEVILVGHSYSGIVAGLVADRIPNRIRHVIYVNAFLPEDGKALVDAFGETQAEEERREIKANDGWWQPPTLEGVAREPDLSLDQQRWLTKQLAPHPGRTVTDQARLNNPLSHQQATYIACRAEGQSSDDMRALCESYNWRFQELNAGHWPMISVPNRLLELFEL